MPVLVTRGIVEQLRSVHAAALVHRYTRVPTVALTDPGTGDPLTDEWGQALVGPGTPVPDQPCLLLFADQTTDDETGHLVVGRHQLRLPHTDPLAVGDLVDSVTDQDGQVLLDTAVVSRVRPTPNRGQTITRTVELAVAESSVLPPGVS